MEAHTFEVDGLTVKLHYEDDAEFCNPRGCDQLGTMVCWHPSYVLGDEQIGANGGAVASDRRHHGQVFETETGRTDFRSMETIERYLRLCRGAVVILPLYLLDHSGLAMSAGANYVGRGDTASGGSDSWGNRRGWDTTMCGFIYTTAERIRELCGDPQLDTDPFYCPRTWPDPERNWNGAAVDWVAGQLLNEVQEYSAWLSGDVYYFTVEDEDGEILDSCGGFIGATYAEEAAREAAEVEAKARRADAEPDFEAALAARS